MTRSAGQRELLAEGDPRVIQPHECRRRFGLAEHAYLATVNDDGSPHLVPMTFALTADTIVTAVDHYPAQ